MYYFRILSKDGEKEIFTCDIGHSRLSQDQMIDHSHSTLDGEFHTWTGVKKAVLGTYFLRKLLRLFLILNIGPM